MTLPAEPEMQQHHDLIAALRSVCRRAAEGDLSGRILHTRSYGELADIAIDLNRLLDLTAAFIGESTASVRAAANGEHHRPFIARGMRGEFRAAAESIRAAHLSLQGEKQESGRQTA